MSIFDTHTHIVAPDTERYPIRPGLAADHDWHVEAPIDAEALLATAGAAGVDKLAFVQAMSCYGSDNRYVLDAARAHPEATISVGIVDDAEQLRRETQSSGLRGVRIFAVSDERPALSDPVTVDIVATAHELGIPVLLMVLERQLPTVGPLAARFPGVSFVLDHCGMSSGSSLFDLARHDNVVLKVSSMTLAAAGAEAPEHLRRLADRFGSGRLMWGSDFPHTHDVPYAELVARAERDAAKLTAAERDRFFRSTARELWPFAS